MNTILTGTGTGDDTYCFYIEHKGRKYVSGGATAIAAIVGCSDMIRERQKKKGNVIQMIFRKFRGAYNVK